MKRMRSWVVGMLLLLGYAAPQVLAGDEGWLTDFDAAKKAAADRKVPILMDFAGSDWCGWCIRLDKEVFATDTFKKYAEGNLVLFLADFPRTKKQISKQKTQNKALMETYKVEGFPTVLLVDAEGKVLGTTGYREGGPEAYIKYLRELLAPKAAE